VSRVHIGAWTCRSGNSVDVFLESVDDGVRHVTVAWDAPPPLSDADYADYVNGILPAMTRRLQEYLECHGRALAIVLR
jgi:hypothetical protein